MTEEPLCQPCEEPSEPPVDSVLGGAPRPPVGHAARRAGQRGDAEDPDLLAKREQELSPAERIEKRRLVLEAATVRHKMTHLPMNKWCPACMKGKMVLTPNRHKSGLADDEALKFGDRMTADDLFALSWNPGVLTDASTPP